MEISNRTLIVAGVILVAAGLLFLAFNFIPGWSFGMAWPVIFLILAAGFYILPFVFPTQRQWMGSLFIPGSILLVLGFFFLYNTITRDWVSWAYGWVLIVGGVGLGLALAAWWGNWGRGTVQVGLWMLLISVAVFALFGALFGGPVLKLASPVLLTISGLLLLWRALRR